MDLMDLAKHLDNQKKLDKQLTSSSGIMDTFDTVGVDSLNFDSKNAEELAKFSQDYAQQYKDSLVQRKIDSVTNAYTEKMNRLGGESALQNYDPNREDDNWLEQKLKSLMGMPVNMYGQEVYTANKEFNQENRDTPVTDLIQNHFIKSSPQYANQMEQVKDPNPIEKPIKSFWDVPNPFKDSAGVANSIGKLVYLLTDKGSKEYSKLDESKKKAIAHNKQLLKDIKSNYKLPNGNIDWNKFANDFNDPTANQVLYAYYKSGPKTKDNPDGQYTKLGTTTRTTLDRMIEDGVIDKSKVIFSIRTKGAETLENIIHGSKDALSNRLYQTGSKMQNELAKEGVHGTTETYKDNLLKVDKNSIDFEANKNKVRQQYKQFNANQSLETYDGVLGEAVDALQAASIRDGSKALEAGAASLQRMLGDKHTTNKVGLEKYFSDLGNKANKIAGYNPKDMRKGQIASENAFVAYKHGLAGRGTEEMLKSIVYQGPQALAQSLPRMAVVGGSTMLAGPAGLALGAMAVSLGDTNDVLNQIEKNNGGKQVPLSKATGVLLGNTMLSMLEYGAFKYAGLGRLAPLGKQEAKVIDIPKILGKANAQTKLETVKELAKIAVGKSKLGKAAKAVGEKALVKGAKNTAKVAAKAGAVVGESMLVEGGEEVFTDTIRAILGQYGTEKYKGKSISDLATSDENVLNALNSFAGGAGAGGITSSPRATGKAYSATKKIIGDNKIKSYGSTIESEEDRTNKIKDIKTRQEATTSTYNELSKINQKLDSVETVQGLKPITDKLGIQLDESKVSNDSVPKIKEQIRAQLNSKITDIESALKHQKIAEDSLNKATAPKVKLSNRLDSVIETLKDPNVKNAKAKLKNIDKYLKTMTTDAIKSVTIDENTPPKVQSLIQQELKRRHESNMYFNQIQEETTTENKPFTKEDFSEMFKDVKLDDEVVPEGEKSSPQKVADIIAKSEDQAPLKDMLDILNSKKEALPKESQQRFADSIEKVKTILDNNGKLDHTLGAGISKGLVNNTLMEKYKVVVTEAPENIYDNDKVYIKEKQRKKERAYPVPRTLEGWSNILTGKDGSISTLFKNKADKTNLTDNKVFTPEVTSMLQKVATSKDLAKKVDPEQHLLFDEKTNATKLQLGVALAMKVVHSAANAKRDIDKNYNFNGEENFVGSKEDIAAELGKEFFDLFNKNTYSNDRLAVENTREDIGNILLKAAEELGLIHKTDKTYMVRDHKKHETDVKRTYENTIDPTTNRKIQTYTTPGYSLTDTSGSKEEQAKRAEEAYSGFKKLNELLEGRNYEPPSKEPVEGPTVSSIGTPLPPEQTEAITISQKHPLYIKKDMIPLLREIKKRWENSGPNVTKFEFVKNQFPNLLGLNESSEYAMIYEDTDKGRSVQRTNAVINLLDNLEEFINTPLFFSYEVAVNNRGHIKQTILDFQGDKYLSRTLLTNSNTANETKTVEGWAKLVDGLVDDLGISPEEILTKSNNKDLEELVDAIENDQLDQYIKNKEITNKEYIPGESSKASSISLALAVVDVRKAYNSDFKTAVKTQHMTESDAMSSGAVNTVLNFIGYDKGVEKLADLLNLFNKDGVVDGYAPLVDGLLKFLNQDSQKELKAQFDEILNAKIFKSLRDMSKSPTMTFLYSSTLNAIKNRFGEEIAEKLIHTAMKGNETSMKIIDGILGEKVNYAAITLAQKAKIVNKYTEKGSLGDVITKTLDEVFRPITTVQDNTINPMYKVMSQIHKELGKDFIPSLPNPFNKDPKYNIPLMQEQKILIGINSDGSGKYIQSFQTNEGSANVLPQHILDSYLMYQTLKNINIPIGTMNVHDAFYANADILPKLEAEYNRLALQMAKEYDFIGNMLEQLKVGRQKLQEAKNATKDPNMNIGKTHLLNQIDTLIADIEPKVEQAQKRKEELFKGKELRIIGGYTTDENGKPRSVETYKKLLNKKHIQEIEQSLEPTPAETKQPEKATKDTMPEFYPKTSTDSRGKDKFVLEHMKKQKERISEVVNSGKPFIVLDLENTWGESNNNGKTEVLEVYGEVKQKKDGKLETIKTVHIKLPPTNKTAYDKQTETQDKYQKLNYFTSDMNSRPKDADTRINNALKKLTDIAGDNAPVIAYNGHRADFKHIASLDVKDNAFANIEPLDAMKAVYSDLFNKRIDDRNSRTQDSVYKHYFPNGKFVDAHTAEADTKALSEIVGKLSEQPTKDTRSKVEKLFDVTKEDLANVNQDSLAIVEEWLNNENIHMDTGESKYDPKTGKVFFETQTGKRDPRFTVDNYQTKLNDLIEIAAHEITHSYEAHYLNSVVKTTKEGKLEVKGNTPKEVKTIVSHIKSLRRELIKKLNDDAQVEFNKDLERTIYSLYGKDAKFPTEITPKTKKKFLKDLRKIPLKTSHFLEFTAVIQTEKENAANVLGITTNVLKALTNLVKKFISKAMNSSYPKDSNLELIHAIKIFNKHGKEFALDNKHLDDSANFIDSLGAGAIDSSYKAIMSPITALDKAVAIILNNKLIPYVKDKALEGFKELEGATKNKSFKTVLEEGYNLIKYKTTNNTYLNRFLFYALGSKRIKNKNYNKIMSVIYNLQQEKQDVDSDNLVKFKAQLAENFTNDELIKMNDTFALSDLGAINAMNSNLLEDLADGKITLDKAIKDFSEGFSPEYIKIAKNTGKFYIRKEVSQDEDGLLNIGNIDTVAFKNKDKLRALTALFALQEADPNLKTFKNTYKKDPTSFKELIGLSTYVNLQTDMIMYGQDGSHEVIHKDIDSNGVNEYFKKNYTFEVLTYDAFKKIDTTDKSVIVVRKPTKNTYGIIAKENIESYTDNLGIKYNRHRNDIWLSEVHDFIDEKKSNIITTLNGDFKAKRLILTKEEKRSLGLLENPADTLLRTWGHNTELLNSQIVRDTLIAEEVEHLKDKDLTAFDKRVADKEKELPWFIDVPKGMAFDDLPKHIKDAYEPIKSSEITDYRGFNKALGQNVLIQRQIKPFAVGYKKFSLVNNESPQLAKDIDKWWKHIITMMKSHMAVTKFPKLISDYTSNIGILVNKGLSPIEIAKYSKEALDLNKQMIDLRNELQFTRFKVAKDPRNKTLIAKMHKLEKDIENHKFYPALEGGFIQSISTSIIQKNFDSVQGLQNDLNEVFSKIFRDDNKKLNNAGNFIMKAAKAGGPFQIENLFMTINAIAQNRNKTIEDVTLDVADKLKSIKKREDIEAYLSELMATPNSSLVQGGSYLMQVADITSRWALYQYNVKNGMSKEDAQQESLETFIDYRVNKPKEFQALSDYGPMLFPTFTIKIQKVIAGLFSTNPIKATATMMIADYLNTENAVIYGSSVLVRDNLIGMPPIDNVSLLFPVQ